MLLLSLLCLISSSTQMSANFVMKDPHVFTSQVDSLKPEKVRSTDKEIRALIDIDQGTREVAENAIKVFDDATVDLTNTLGKLQQSNDEVGDHKTKIAHLKDLLVVKEKNFSAADTKVKNKQAQYEKVKESVASEKAVLDKVLDLLQQLKNGDAGKGFIASVEAEKKGLVFMSRTSRLLTSPSFLAALAKADPTAIQDVINLVNKLIDINEQAKADALADLRKAQYEKVTSANELRDIKDSLAGLEKDLVAEEKNVSPLAEDNESKTLLQKSTKGLLATAQTELDTKHP